jgi:putative peptidoglycan lipid II flippase
VVRLAAPIIFGLAVAEINLVIISSLANWIDPDHGAKALEYSNRLWKLPTRFIGAGIAIAVLPYLSQSYAQEDHNGFRRDFSLGMRNALFLTVPAALALLVLADPLPRLLFSFTAEGYARTAQTLFWSALGIIPLTAVYLLARAFYARHETIIPVKAGVAAVVACVASAYPLGKLMGVPGLGLAMSLGNLVNAVLLAFMLYRRVGNLGGGEILRSLLRLLPAGGGFILATAATLWFTRQRLGVTSIAAELVNVVAPLSVGLAVFLALAWVFRVQELRSAGRLLLRRGRRGRPAPAEMDELQ